MLTGVNLALHIHLIRAHGESEYKNIHTQYQ